MASWNPFARLTKTHRIGVVIAIATAFLILELIVGFLTRSLVLVADAFHILSDIIGYVVALFAARYAGGTAKGVSRSGAPGYTFGFRRAEVLGGFFNGAFLSALGVSVLLQSIERFIEPSHITNPILVMAVGAAGIGSNLLMLLILGGHSHGGHSHGGHAHIGHSHNRHEHGTAPAHVHGLDAAAVALVDPTSHSGHAHARRNDQARPASRFADLNMLGVLIHILGDALNSVAVIIAGGVYLATEFTYADQIASVLVGGMIIGTALPLVLRAGRTLLGAVPAGIDVQGVREDVERITGTGTVHDLHVWSSDNKTVEASLHIMQDNASLTSFETASGAIRNCLHHWGIHSSTFQPEVMAQSVHDGRIADAQLPVQGPQISNTTPTDALYSRLPLRCRRQCSAGCPTSALAE